MTDRERLERAQRARSRIVRVLYWLVWLVLRVYAVARPLRIIGEHGIGPQPHPLFLRWFLTSRPRTPQETGTPGWYLHNYRQPDFDRREHNHPWRVARTFILRGGYVETRDGVRRVRMPGDTAVITSREYHRITEVLPNTWTLFYAGPKHGRGWGFR